jgi:hypothetical protein
MSKLTVVPAGRSSAKDKFVQTAMPWPATTRAMYAFTVPVNGDGGGKTVEVPIAIKLTTETRSGSLALNNLLSSVPDSNPVLKQSPCDMVEVPVRVSGGVALRVPVVLAVCEPALGKPEAVSEPVSLSLGDNAGDADEAAWDGRSATSASQARAARMV